MFTQWDVWTVFWEHQAPGAGAPGKPRPAVLLSDDEEIAKGGSLLFIKISKQSYPGVPDIRLDRNDGDEFDCTGLHVSPSYIHYTSVQAVDRSRVGERAGHLGEATVEFLIALIEQEKRNRRARRSGGS